MKDIYSLKKKWRLLKILVKLHTSWLIICCIQNLEDNELLPCRSAKQFAGSTILNSPESLARSAHSPPRISRFQDSKPSDESWDHMRDLRRHGNHHKQITHKTRNISLLSIAEPILLCWNVIEHQTATRPNPHALPGRLTWRDPTWHIGSKHASPRVGRPASLKASPSTLKNTGSQADSHSSCLVSRCRCYAAESSQLIRGDTRGAQLHHLACSADISKRDFRDLDGPRDCTRMGSNASFCN